MSVADPAASYAIAWWKDRHDKGYFPTMECHLNWKVYDEAPGYLIEHVAPTKADDVLEVGCGYGQWVHPVSRLVRSIVGIDIHQILIDKSVEKLADCPNARCVLSDGLTIPFADESFSLVYSISVFQHMPRSIVLGYFKEIARVMNPDGRALLHFRFADGIGEYSQDITANHKGDWSTGWTEDEAMDAARSVGWSAKAVIRDYSMLLIAKRAA